MNNFFRRIRQNLLSQNSFSKYILYAIGEIILVVIGILIALQINNWNEYNKTVALAQNYILDIRKDLVLDTITFNSAINRVRGTIEHNKSLLKPEYTNKLTVDSLFSIIKTSFHSTRVYHIDNATYLKLSNTGFLESGLFNSIFKDINTYYNKEYVAYSEFIEWDEEQSLDIFHSDFLGTYKNVLDLQSLEIEQKGLISSQKKKEANLTMRNLISSTEFRNHTWTNYRRKEHVLDRLLLQGQIAANLIDKINAELENK